MEIKIKLEVHAYAEEKLCDEVFDDPPFYGINGPEIMVPLRNKRDYVTQFEYNNNTRVVDAINAVKYEVWGRNGEIEWAPTSYSFLVDGERYYIDNDECNFSELILKYLDPNHTGTITVGILVSCNAGDVGGAWPLRFYVRSHESGSHHEAHLHVRDVGHQYEASVRISDGEIIAGKLPRKLARLAKESVLADQEYFYKCWNTMTDGLKVDINHHYGYIQY